MTNENPVVPGTETPVSPTPPADTPVPSAVPAGANAPGVSFGATPLNTPSGTSLPGVPVQATIADLPSGANVPPVPSGSNGSDRPSGTSASNVPTGSNAPAGTTPLTAAAPHGYGYYMTPVPMAPPPSTLAVREAAKLKKSPLMMLFTFLASYLYAELMLQGSMSGVAIPIYLAGFYLVAIWYLAGKTEAFSLSGCLLLIPVTLLSASFALIDSPMANFVTTLVLLVLIPLQLTVMAGGGKPDRMAVLGTVFFTTIGIPLCNLGGTFRILSRENKEKKKISTLLWAAIGFLCSIPLLVIFVALFSSGDAVFRAGLTRLFAWIDMDLTGFMFNLLMAALVTLFIVPFFLSLRAAKRKDFPETNPRGALPQALILSFLSGILLIQAVFVGIQISFLFPGTGTSPLPKGYTYASYVHEGFAQIVTAALLTALIIALVWRLCRKDEKGMLPLGVRLCLTLLGLLDFALCASAYFRLFLYIQTYSLSVLRLSVCWLMALGMLLILGILFKIWLPRLKLFSWSLAVVLFMTILLNGLNMDRTVAKYNVDRYLQSGYTYQLDVYYFETLSPAALPELRRLRDNPDAYKHLDEDEQHSLNYAMEQMEEQIQSRSWRSTRLLQG